jgi:glycosyltransferase involved in cell wall biosynthesis
MNPLISAVVPVYNGAEFLSDAIRSILKQEYEPLEIIIVDDGSTDGTAGLVAGFHPRLQYHYQDNQGPATARNTGVTASRGEILAFLDADDLWPGDKLQTQIRHLRARPDLEVVVGHTRCFGPGGPDTCPPGMANPVVLTAQLGSALFRRSAFAKVGLFDEALRFSEDHDWFLRARESALPMLALAETTLYHRRHGNNMTREPAATGYQLTEVLKKSLDRRRGRGGSASAIPRMSDFLESKPRPRCRLGGS